MNIYKRFARKQIFIRWLILMLLLGYWFCLPSRLFETPYCTVLEDKDGELLGAHIAADGQWRFPLVDSVPMKFKIALLNFEDKRFYFHFGVDAFSFSRALFQNIKKMGVVSGGSTLTMQVIRMSRGNQSRNIFQKIIEMIWATRLELTNSKNTILKMYVSHVPYGGNVVGLDAGAWRYFGRKPYQLSWAESAMLAILPNNPAIIHPGRNRDLLLQKRNKLLNRLFREKYLTKEEYLLAIDEPLPDKPRPFPRYAPHLLGRIEAENKNIQNNSKIKTTLSLQLQQKSIDILQRHSVALRGNGISNAAVIVVDVETGNVLSYVGNISAPDSSKNHSDVDIITANRSSGSILKPFLYAAMLTSGDIMPSALVPDIPTTIGGYAPQNYNLGYDGAIPAHKALARSLNVPAVKMLQNYGVSRFHNALQKLGLTSVTKDASHYGLSLILGGCESKLWDLVGIYSSMARVLNHYTTNNGMYNQQDFANLNFYKSKKLLNKKTSPELEEGSLLSASAIWLTFKALLEVERPEEENNWLQFSSTQKIAWKTGTSFGFRDAWAVGITPRYVVGVWVGNADGEGRPELIGVKSAAPILFDIFKQLPVGADWFDEPYDDMVKVVSCHESGYLASPNCENLDSVWVPAQCVKTVPCPFHKIIHLDATEKWRVTSDCEQTDRIVNKKWFVLPPAIEWFYKTKNFNYKVLPPMRKDCADKLIGSDLRLMELIYPQNKAKIYIPIELDGTEGKTIFKAAHRRPEMSVYWHIDNMFIGQTKSLHQLAFQPEIGKHLLTLVDENGEKCSIEFEILGKRKLP